MRLRRADVDHAAAIFVELTSDSVYICTFKIIIAAVGLIGERLHAMVPTCDTTVRLISLRMANSREVKRYVDHS
jgi:uncharacterized DUF497 family protein